MKLEHVMSEQHGDDQRHRGRDDAPEEQADADLLQAGDEPRAGVDADDGDEHVQAERVHEPERGRRDAAERRAHRPQVAEHEPGEQRAAGRRQADRNAAPFVAERADQAADHDAARDGRCRWPRPAGRRSPSAVTAASRGACCPTIVRMSPRRISVSGQDRDLDHVAHDLAQVDAAREGLFGELAQRLAVDRLVRDEHVDRVDGHVEQFAVVDLGHGWLDLSTSTWRGPEIATTSPGSSTVSASASMICLAAANSLDEDAQAGKKVAHRPAREPARRVDAIGAQLDGAIGREHAWLEAAAPPPSLPFILGARRGQVDADQLRTELGQDDRRADRAEDVGDRIADRDRHPGTLCLRRVEPQTPDLVGRDADRRRDRLRAGIEPAA